MGQARIFHLMLKLKLAFGILATLATIGFSTSAQAEPPAPNPPRSCSMVPPNLKQARTLIERGDWRAAISRLEFAVQTGEMRKAGDRPAVDFEKCILPLYQKAADRVVQDLTLKSQLERINWLIRVGEGSRQAQLEMAIPDACERLEVPLRPKDLRDNETLLYPVFGEEQAYWLIGRKPSKNTKAWLLLPSSNVLGREQLKKSLEEIRYYTGALYCGAFENCTSPWFQREGETDYPETLGGQEAFSEKLDIEFLKILPKEARAYLAEILRSTDQRHEGVLIISPDPILRSVPWALLKMRDTKLGARANYLIDSSAIAIIPGLAYVQPTSSRPAKRVLVAGGDASLTENEVDQMALAASNLDNRMRGEGWAPKSVLVGSKKEGKQSSASRAELEDALGIGEGRRSGPISAQSGIDALLVFAHGTFKPDGDAIESGISLPAPDPRRTLIPFGLLSENLRTRNFGKQPIHLLVIGACESASSAPGQIGMAGAALQAGVETVIGSAFSVNIETMGPLLVGNGTLSPSVSFSEAHFEGRETAVQALRRAQITMINHPERAKNKDEMESSGTEYAAYSIAQISAFQLVGNWR